MTTIKATCPTCGEVTLTPEDIELRVDRSENAESSYAFTCPECLCSVRKPANERVVRLLISGGVEVFELEAPRVPLSERFDGPPITHDDLLDFHALLGTDDWFEDLAAQVRRQNVS
ncbi:MAG TPA: hypothetical protein VIK95_12725 [Egibacteraceae bacterium]